MRQVLGLGSGVLIAHLITLAVSPIITRIYSPEEFGEFALFTSIVTILTLVATGSYEFSIVLPKREKTALSIFKVSVLCAVGFSTLLLVLLSIFYSPITEFASVSTVFLLLIPFAVLFNSLNGSYTYWFNRNEYFDEFAIAKVSMSVGTGIFQVGLGALGLTSFGLLIGLIVGRVFSVGTMAFKKVTEIGKLFSGWFKDDLRQAAKTYSDHPKFVLISSLLSSISIEVPVFLITSFFGDQALGYYGLALRILMAPVTLISLSVGHVYYQKFAAKRNRQELLAPYLLNLWGTLSLIGILPFTMLFFLSEPIFVIVFGDEWTGAGIVAKHLSPMLFFLFVVNPTSKSLLVLGKQKIMPLFSISSLLIRLATLFIGYYYYDFYTAIALMVGGQILVYIVQAAYTYISAKNLDNSISKERFVP